MDMNLYRERLNRLNILKIRLIKSRVNYKKSSFMYVTYYKLCHLSSIITENVPDVCKLLQFMSFSVNSVNFCG
ncbi:hypothetical protein Hanom_Chr03g00220521 [Helianthus anomalus]